jgi:tight adherence protein B
MHFVKVFQTAKRTDGDLISITRLTAEKISQKIEVKREIHTMIAGKKMEGRIMNCIPLAMILYFWICSPDFLDCMYQSSGRMVMTVLMLIYIATYYWSSRVSDINV